ncbi:MAG: signal peptidase I [Oscillospiraceae bacterium]|nr:signal peptidase I [Oscillospiraceae bacterium]
MTKSISTKKLFLLSEAAVVLVVLAAVQVVMFLVPGEFVPIYQRVFRPAVYFAVTIIYLIYSGRDERGAVKARESVAVAVFFAVLYAGAFAVTGIFLGFSRNMEVSSLQSVIRNFWIYGTTAILTEILRIRIIRGAPEKYRDKIAPIVVFVYTFIQIDEARRLFTLEIRGILEFFFISFLPVLVLNTLLTHMARGGALKSLIVIRLLSLAPALLPVLPGVHRAVWAAVVSTLYFLAMFIYILSTKESNPQAARITKRYAKYDKKPLKAPIFFTVCVVLLFMFNAKVFRYYPSVVLTPSMSGTFEPGAVVFIEKVKPERVYYTVEQGDVIHFKYRSVERVHRVMDFRYSSDDELLYITQGDANPAPDSTPVKQEEVYGIVKAYIPHLGYPVLIWDSFFRRQAQPL